MESTITLNVRGFKYQVLNENFLKEINDPQSLIIEFCNLQTNLRFFSRAVSAGLVI